MAGGENCIHDDGMDGEGWIEREVKCGMEQRALVQEEHWVMARGGIGCDRELWDTRDSIRDGGGCRDSPA